MLANLRVRESVPFSRIYYYIEWQTERENKIIL